MASHSNQTGWRRFFSNHQVPQPGPIILDRRHIYILPTRGGLMFVLVLFVMLLGSMNYNNSMGYALTFLLGSMALVSMLHTHRTLLNLRVEAGKVAPVFAGETAQFQLWIDNQGQRARYALVWLPNFFKKTKWLRDSNLNQSQVQIMTDIPANQRFNLKLPLSTTQRGRLALGRITVYSRFPLGLFHAWSYIHLDISTLVYPQPQGHKNLPHGQQTDNSGEGRPRDGGGEDFIGYRDYQSGDSPRHIDWKAVARGQDWMIKQFGGLSSAQVWLTWDDVQMLNNMEAALSQLCLWILVAESQGASYGLKLPDSVIEPNTGERHREHCLQTLALFRQEGER